MISDNTLITFYQKDGKYKIEVCDLDRASQDFYALKTFEYESDIPADKGDLIINENTVFISPHNKQLNLIDGEWYLNDFVSTTPLVNVVEDQFEDLDINNITASGFIQVIAEPQFSTNIQLGVYKIIVGDREFVTSPILSQDSKEAIAQKIFEAVELDNYLIEVTQTTNLQIYLQRVLDDGGFIYNLKELTNSFIELGDTGLSLITFKADRFGSDLNKVIQIIPEGINQNVENLLASFIAYSDIRGGVDVDFTDESLGTLRQQTDYYYKVRYIYSDGHITKTNFPAYFRTTNFKRLAILDIQMEKDLDGSSFVGLEIYRKEEGSNFRLIKRIINTTQETYRIGNKFFYRFLDEGLLGSDILEEKEYVWTREHKTHAFARDRYLRSNIKYDDRRIDVEATIDYNETDSQEVLPFNTKVELYGRGRFTDGLESFHVFADKLEYRPTNPLDADDALSSVVQTNYNNLKELGLYVKYETIRQNRFTIPFRSIEFYNINIPSNATRNETIKDTPSNPHIFYGWRYVRFNEVTFKYEIFDATWDNNPKAKEEETNFKDYKFEVDEVEILESDANTSRASIIRVTVLGVSNIYRFRSVGLGGAIYELATLDQLKTAATLGKLKIRSTAVIGFKEDLINLEIANANIRDLSDDYSNEAIEQGYPPRENRVYIVLPSDTQYSEIAFYSTTNIAFNTATGRDRLGGGSLSSFELLDLTQERNELVSSFLTANQDYYNLISTDNVLESDGVIYVGKVTNFVNDNITLNLRTGYRKVEQNSFIYWVPVESRITEVLLTEDDLQTFQFDYPNQIIWSNAYIRGSKINGLRQFTFNNFINLSTEYGEIKKIVYYNNNVVVFCKRGVAIVSVGEVLTQTPSGQTFVDTTRFLNSEQWILKNVSNIQTNSIRQYENMLFFSDGVDVWMFSDSLSNISQGAIRLNLPDDKAVASIDVEFKEYRISDDVHTYAFNFEIQEWFGPYTYKDKASVSYTGNLYSVVEDKLVVHNEGNKYGEKEYETVISSVANDANEASINKLFRKFYLELRGAARFLYGKEYNNLKEVDLEEKRKINNVYQIGIDSNNKNANKIYWSVKTKSKDFVLKLVSFIWTPRIRR
jgi:hypothetical protein